MVVQWQKKGRRSGCREYVANDQTRVRGAVGFGQTLSVERPSTTKRQDLCHEM